MSTALAGLQDDHAIAQTLARQVHAVAEGESVEINLTGPNSFTFRSPEVHPPDRPPELVIPIDVARGSLGEIRLWRSEPAISHNERRLFQTFARQGALALERAWLAQAESRAKVLEESDG